METQIHRCGVLSQCGFKISTGASLKIGIPLGTQGVTPSEKDEMELLHLLNVTALLTSSHVSGKLINYIICDPISSKFLYSLFILKVPSLPPQFL